MSELEQQLFISCSKGNSEEVCYTSNLEDRKKKDFPFLLDKTIQQHQFEKKFPDRFNLSLATKVLFVLQRISYRKELARC